MHRHFRLFRRSLTSLTCSLSPAPSPSLLCSPCFCFPRDANPLAAWALPENADIERFWALRRPKQAGTLTLRGSGSRCSITSTMAIISQPTREPQPCREDERAEEFGRRKGRKMEEGEGRAGGTGETREREGAAQQQVNGPDSPADMPPTSGRTQDALVKSSSISPTCQKSRGWCVSLGQPAWIPRGQEGGWVCWTLRAPLPPPVARKWSGLVMLEATDSPASGRLRQGESARRTSAARFGFVGSRSGGDCRVCHSHAPPLSSSKPFPPKVQTDVISLPLAVCY